MHENLTRVGWEIIGVRTDILPLNKLELSKLNDLGEEIENPTFNTAVVII